MKKLSVLLFILLIIQLYGCSDHASEMNESVVSTSEASASEFETPAEEFYDDNRNISTKSENDSASTDNKETENASASTYNTESENASASTYNTETENMTSQSEEPIATANDNYYSVATDISCADVESYAAQIRQQFLEQDWLAISSEIAYPITISGSTYYNSTEFLDASNSFDGNLEEAFLEALEEEDCVEMFCNWQGIMLGETGQVWISGIRDKDFTSQGLKIIAINGLLKSNE
ncbi:MAG: hypothetical protein HDR01_08710 [Lachnospiraceae bacterium]|nr:hypothetical protein [Lachnospiraceae bacterium]